MVEKCPAKYKNLNYIQSFSEQGYATIQLMQQACMNDEWLRQRVIKLNYLTAPAVRKWYKNGEWVNPKLSYGWGLNSQGDVCFNSSIEKRIFIDFKDDDDLIDMDKTDAIIMSAVDNETEKPLESNDDLVENDYRSDGKLFNLDANGEITGAVNDTDDIETGVIDYWCQLPFENEADKKTYTTTNVIAGQTEIVDKTTGTTGNKVVNSAWYVGFNKSNNYYVRPDWLNDWRDEEIPSVARGQTFQANETGKLASINLILDYTGTQSSDCGSPLYVQIWKTKKANRVKTVWNNETKQMEKVYKKHSDNTGGDYNLVNGKYTKVESGTGNYSLVYEKVPVPDTTNSGIYNPLAEAVYNPSKMSTFGEVNIKFDKECQLTKGQSYFIALFSPLSEWKHCPRWGGWGRNCRKDKKYEYGNAFLSEDNGRTWIRYGRNDTSVSYKQGKYVPQDFAFTCYIRSRDKIDEKTEDLVYCFDGQIDDADEDNPRYLYLKPIYCNPLRTIRIDAQHDVPNGTKLVYQYSLTGDVTKEDDWHTATLGSTYNITGNTAPQVVFVRVKLSRETEPKSETTVIEGQSIQHSPYWTSTPKIYSMNVTLNTELPLSMYVRTFEWQPRTDAMLGARIWGRVFAPFETDPTVTCRAEIVTNEKPTDHFTLIELENILEYSKKKVSQSKLDDTTYASPLKTLLVTYDNDTYSLDNLAEYIYQNQDVLKELKQYHIYVLPYANKDFLYLLSFNSEENESMKIDISEDDGEFVLGGLQLKNEVAYPILECTYTPEGSTTDVTSYGEWYDYTFDYENNQLFFRDDILSQMTLGDIAVTYNKCFIRGLTYDEVGIHTNSDTGLKEEGLILDYFKETFIITDEQVETRRVGLRVEPVDPIREVILNRDTEKEIELYEGFDYIVDIDSHEIIFNVTNIDGVSSVLSTGDVLEVVYTPNLTANALSLGYWCTRTNKDKQVRIKSSYWEYKA